jgi:hypothetical protein
VRVTDWRWNLTPLSPAGSLNGIRGRFNIGQDLDRVRVGGLSLQELALRRQTSFTTFALQGAREQVFDLRARHSLAGFATIIGRFDVTSNTKKSARSAMSDPRSHRRAAGSFHHDRRRDRCGLAAAVSGFCRNAVCVPGLRPGSIKSCLKRGPYAGARGATQVFTFWLSEQGLLLRV